MTDPWTVGKGRLRWRDRIEARLAGLSRQQVRLIVAPWRPVSGGAEQGHGLLAGRLVFGDARAKAKPGTPLWQVAAPTPEFEAARHGFVWLDDLAAAGTPEAYRTGREWLADWMTRFGRGRGPGWTLAETSCRLGAVIRHAAWLSSGPDGLAPERLERFFARHRRFAMNRFQTMPEGLVQFELCANLILAGCALDMSERLRSAAQAVLEQACRDWIRPDGTLPNRCPEALARVLHHLALAAEVLSDTDHQLRPQHRQALTCIPAAVRGLRHNDGGLARFHGGGAGNCAQIDAALSVIGRKGQRTSDRPMGLVRLVRGHTSIISDCAAPPAGRDAGAFGHASTLAFEATIGRHPLIVNCGAGARFGADWRRASRNTPSHSTLTLDGQSSSRFGKARRDGEDLIEGPGDIQCDVWASGLAAQLVAAHNGYAESYGLIHARRLELSAQGTALQGEDMLSAVTEIERRQFAHRQGLLSTGRGVPFAVRFHLHPAVRGMVDPDLDRVLLTLPNNEVWVFGHRSDCTIRLDPSVYLENTDPEPRATQQIVLEGLASRPETLVRWSLTQEVGAPPNRRDVQPDDKTDPA
ncbi:heparinase II/III family protein [Pseudoruegeria sp. SK021]|uniref:heparinase II/III family protein n=1 Tax=Pseudoruegeria sp. SK021 TaxID=1933035 RepID=UPI000A32656C|nr:heparinase II/III family protein [Pseudoruegeria sp. SK021]